MFGENSFAGFTGWAVASAGDINGDGLGDMLVSGQEGGSVYAGSVYCGIRTERRIFTGPGPWAHDRKRSFRIDGSANGDNFGFSVSAPVTSMGWLRHIIVGAYKADPTGIGNEGAGYVIFGRGDLQLPLN